MAKTQMTNNGGNRALVVYYCGEYDVGSFKDIVRKQQGSAAAAPTPATESK